MGFGYHLAQIEDALENDFEMALLAGGFPRVDAWIGLESSGSPLMFRWPDGSVATYTAWAPGEPGSSSSCVRIEDTGDWMIASCGTSGAYVCEAP